MRLSWQRRGKMMTNWALFWHFHIWVVWRAQCFLYGSTSTLTTFQYCFFKKKLKKRQHENSFVPLPSGWVSVECEFCKGLTFGPLSHPPPWFRENILLRATHPNLQVTESMIALTFSTLTLKRCTIWNPSAFLLRFSTVRSLKLNKIWVCQGSNNILNVLWKFASTDSNEPFFKKL